VQSTNAKMLRRRMERTSVRSCKYNSRRRLLATPVSRLGTERRRTCWTFSQGVAWRCPGAGSFRPVRPRGRVAGSERSLEFRLPRRARLSYAAERSESRFASDGPVGCKLARALLF